MYDIYCTSKAASNERHRAQIEQILQELYKKKFKICFIRYIKVSACSRVMCCRRQKKITKDRVVDTFKQSTILLCFLTNEYSQKEMCSDQITRANELGKRVIYVLLEALDIEKLRISSLILDKSMVFEFYSDRVQYERLFESLGKILTKPMKKLKQFDFFFSHQGTSKRLVLDAYERLVQLGYTIWVDRDQLYDFIGGDLHEKLAEGIQESIFFVCFLSKQYTESFNCQLEYKYALAKKKPALFIVLEKFDIPPSIDIYLSNSLRLDAYKDVKEGLEVLNEKSFNRFMKSINRLKMEGEARMLNEETCSMLETSKSLVKAKEILKRDLEMSKSSTGIKQRRLNVMNSTIESHNLEIDQIKVDIGALNARLANEEQTAEQEYRTHSDYNDINLRISIASEKLKGILSDQAYFINKSQQITEDLVALSNDQMKLLSEQYDLKETAVKRNLYAFTEMEKEVLQQRIRAKEAERDRVNQTIDVLRGKHKEIAQEMDEIEESIRKFEAYVPKFADIFEAVANGSLEEMNYWLRKEGESDTTTPKCDPNILLQKASEKGQRHIVEFLAKKQVPINSMNSEGRTALMLACEKGQRSTVEFLLSKNADLETRDRYGQTALMLACEKGFKYIIEILVNNNADLRTRDDLGNTMLIIASKNGHNELFEYLLSKHVNVNESNNSGWTPLMAASENGHKYIVQYLLSQDANVNAQNNEGNTALIVATTNNQQYIVDCLLHKNIDIQLKNKDGKTALVIANEKGFKEIVHILKAFRIK